jgi:hypothetical protein
MSIDWTIIGPFLGVGVAAILMAMFDGRRTTASGRAIDLMAEKRRKVRGSKVVEQAE